MGTALGGAETVTPPHLQNEVTAVITAEPLSPCSGLIAYQGESEGFMPPK